MFRANNFFSFQDTTGSNIYYKINKAKTIELVVPCAQLTCINKQTKKNINHYVFHICPQYTEQTAQCTAATSSEE